MRGIKFFVGLIASLLIWGLVGVCIAQEQRVISTKQITEIPKEDKVLLDNFTVLPTTKTLEVNVFTWSYDAEGKVVSRSHSRKLDPIMDIQDNLDTPLENEENLEYSSLQPELDKLIDKLIQVIQAREAE